MVLNKEADIELESVNALRASFLSAKAYSMLKPGKQKAISAKTWLKAT